MIITSFTVFLLAFVFIGILSILQHRRTNFDYLLAGQCVKPWLVALSAVASNNSGFMFIGMIGCTYSIGLSSIWLLIGWVCGDFFASTFIHKHLRITAGRQKVLSFAGVLSSWHGTEYRLLRFVGGVITVVFLGTSAAAQFNAGSKALYVLFDWEYSFGAIIGAGIALLYCFSGGIRASIWTDAAQSFVMIFAMSLLSYVAVAKVGGIGAFFTALYDISPTYMNLLPTDLPSNVPAASFLFVIGWMFSGFSIVGQPHVMVRFMAMDTPKSMTRVRVYYYGWYTAFSALTLCVGLAARLLLPETQNFDAELALPTLAQSLLPEILVGLVLAGLFSASISTADSQILSCSAAITNDLSQTRNKSYLMSKLATILVVLIALFIAIAGSKSVYYLVLIGWSALASAFVPLLTVYVLGGKPSEKLALSMMGSGLCAMLIWHHFGLGDLIYEGTPGIISGLLVYGVHKVFAVISTRYTDQVSGARCQVARRCAPD